MIAYLRLPQFLSFWNSLEKYLGCPLRYVFIGCGNNKACGLSKLDGMLWEGRGAHGSAIKGCNNLGGLGLKRQPKSAWKKRRIAQSMQVTRVWLLCVVKRLEHVRVVASLVVPWGARSQGVRLGRAQYVPPSMLITIYSHYVNSTL